MIRIVFFGTAEFGIASLRQIRTASDMECVAIVTQPPRPQGRSLLATPSPVARYAASVGIPILAWERLRGSDVLSTLAALKPDILVVASYGLLIPKEILDLTPAKAINIHGSILPADRGATPIETALFRGDTKTGVTFMQMTPGLDDGPILVSFPYSLQPQDRATSVEAALARLAAEHAVDTIRGVSAGTLIGQPQDSRQATMTKKLRREDGRCLWEDAGQEERRIRAYDPWPGAWTEFRGRRLKFLDAQVVPQALPETTAPGTILGLSQFGGWGVACRTGVFAPIKIQLAGKQPQSARSFLDVFPDAVGQVFD